MRFTLIFSLLILIQGISQTHNDLQVKLDSNTRKYGFVDSLNVFVIKPQYDEVNNFISDYTSVKAGEFWGVIDVKGRFILKPQYSTISPVYKECFLEYGENMRFRNIKGDIKLEYLFIPAPFEKINDMRFDPKLQEMEDAELVLRVLEIHQTRFCHYYERNRILNMIALKIEEALILTVDFVLENPKQVKEWLKLDKEFEEAFEKNQIECCGYGPVWYR